MRPRAEDTTTMRVNRRSVSLVIAALGCLLFPFGGFMLFPLALDLWDDNRDRSATA